MNEKPININDVLAREDYNEAGRLARRFGRNIVEVDGVWRFKQNKLIRYLVDEIVDLNRMKIEFHNRKFSLDEYMQFYMDMGYSLSGFYEIFGQSEAEEWGLPGALKRESDEYLQTPIDWMLATSPE